MKTVLIVDDREENLYYLEAVLASQGWVVQRARHGAEALTRARQHPPDLVVSDLLMPVMDGYTLLRHWKADPALRRAPFVVYTATYTEPADEALALSLGADAFMLKPLEPQDLLARIAEVLARPGPALPERSVEDSEALARAYSETLIRKLEEKSLQLIEANRALQADNEARRRAEFALGERVKELRALHEVARLLSDDARPDDAMLGAVAAVIPPAMMHAEAAAARVTYGTGAAATPDFRETPWLLEAPFATADGREGRVQIAYLREFPPAGEGPFVPEERALVDSLVEMLRVAMERRRTTERLREQAALLDKARDAIVVRDMHHRISFWNRSAERLYGWTRAEALGRRVDELLYFDTAQYQQAFAATVADGEWSGELRQRTSTGCELVVEGRWSLVRDEAGRPAQILAINTDATERKQLEQQMLRAQRIESIGNLAGGIAHDLNNVLAPILMAVGLLKLEVGAEQGDLLEMIESSARRGADMVGQILSFARGTEGKKEPVRLSVVLRELSRLVVETFPRNVKARFEVPDDAWPVLAERTQLHQVLLNLCVNARDAMPGGGELTVTCSNLVLNERHAGMPVDARIGRFIRIDVVDTGTGIPEAILERIWEPFFTTKEAGKGTGLGLATTLGIVRGHGGFITVDSREGQGTRFSVFLPAMREAAEAAASPASTALPRGEGQLILIVDDEASIRQITRQTLEAAGYRALSAADGAEGLARFLEHRTEVAAVIVDMVMPVMDGAATAEALRRIDPAVPIIGTSGLLGGHAPKPTQAVSELLEKPFTASTLLGAVRRAVAAKAP